MFAAAAVYAPPLRAQDGGSRERPGFIDVACPGAAIGAGGFVVGGLLGIAVADCPGTGNEGLCALGRHWLQESIRYRAPMIHPLNLLQIELLAKAEWSEGGAPVP